jgi:SAM-dependent methyltransferase
MGELTYAADADAIRGRFVPAATSDVRVRIECDGAHWATVPAFPDPGTPGMFEFSCTLAPVSETTRSSVTARAPGGMLLGSNDVRRQPLRNSHGLLASVVYATDHHPFFALPWLTFDGTKITLSGMHLPPEGDPAELELEFGPGVSYDLRYGMRVPAFRTQYWYWPNADLSGFILEIDLAASERTSDPFHFRFLYPAPSRFGGGKRSIDMWLPRDLGSFRGFPTDSSQLTRVQTGSTSASSSMTGYHAFKTLEALFASTGIDPDSGPVVLDWGCGHGRVTCHFIDQWPLAKMYGTDIDAENIAWCNEHLAPERFVVAPLWPPCEFADGTFDGIFGISVVTHLTAEAQRAWLAELARILKPGGTALLTFSADASAAFTSYWRDAAWWSRWQELAFNDEQIDTALAGKISEPEYYRNTLQSTPGFVRECGRHFDVLSIEPAIFGGYQDCAILRKPLAASRLGEQ